MKPEWLLLFEDPLDEDADFSLLDEACPVCGAAPRTWCSAFRTPRASSGFGRRMMKVGIVHARRVGQ